MHLDSEQEYKHMIKLDIGTYTSNGVFHADNVPPIQPATSSPKLPAMGILGRTNSVNPCLDAQLVACLVHKKQM